MNSYFILTDNSKEGREELILELTSDGMAYIWPRFPDLSQTVPPSASDQDREAYMADGDFLEHSSFYHNVSDFMRHSKFYLKHYSHREIGEYESIRACRVALETP